MDAIEGGLSPKVWGVRWDEYIPPHLIQSDYYPYESLPSVYREARVVLADHWPDMAREGFVANRLFDAVATGAHVISDKVDGIEQLFDGAVQTYSTSEELAWLASPLGLIAAFPDSAGMTRIASSVAEHHSFDVRAEVLVRDVLELWGGGR